MLSVHWGGQALLLLHDRAVWWPARRTLIVADLHLGKPAAFRAAGVPVPEPVTQHDLGRLAGLIDRLAPDRMVVLGDLLHAPDGLSPETIDQVAWWRSRYAALHIDLVRGNHDVRCGASPAEWRIAEHHPPVIDGGLAFAHEPAEVRGASVLAGHLHPCVRLGGSAGASLRSPCFWFGRSIGVLPAFGTFTGGARIRPRQGDRVFAIGPECVIEVAGRPARFRRAASSPAPDSP